MRLFLLRHGQTQANLANRFSGRHHSPLTKKGVQQMKGVRGWFSENKIQVNAFYCSPLKRAKQSALIVNEALHKPLIVDDRLAEIDFGKAEGMTKREIGQMFPGMLEERSKRRFFFQMEKGESYALGQKRVIPFLEELKEKRGKDSVAVLAHECLNRTIIGYFFNLTPEETLAVAFPNNCILEIDLSKKTSKWVLAGEKKKGKGWVKEKN
ncbi:MAG: histidine phosphatase family protein [Candidatus Diapherotrites archaeon]